MHGAWLSPAGAVHFRRDLPEPQRLPGESLVEVILAGICATDLALTQGYMNFEGTLGHEFVGLVIDGPLKGRRVVGEINAGCGKCEACLGQIKLDARHCSQRSVLGILDRQGAFAQRLVLPHGNLLEVPDEVSDQAAVFVEPLAAAYQLLLEVKPVAGTRVLVAGDGRLGLLIVRVLVAAGCMVDLAGHHEGRAPAGSKARAGLLDSDQRPSLGERYELVVDATGNPNVLARLMAWVRPKGTLVLKTTATASSELDLTALVIDEVRLVGSRCGRFAPALQALSSGRIEVDSLIHQTFPLAEVEAALDQAAQPGVLKVLINCQEQ